MASPALLHAHHSGFSQSGDMLRLHCNENPYGPPHGVTDTVAKEVQDWCSAYPDSDCTAISERIATYHGLDADMVATSNGLDEMVLLTALTFLRPGDPVAITEATFPGYAAAATSVGATIRSVPLADYRVSVADLCAQFDGAELAYICNPHNPTGSVLGPEGVEKILAAAETARVLPVFDEAYMEFADHGREYAIDAVRQGRRLLVLRTFSKLWGLASLRAGYALGPADVIEPIRRTRQTLPFSMNRLAQRAALAALDCEGHPDEMRARTNVAKQRLYDGLTQAGIEFQRSATNFVLVRVRGDSAVITSRLAEEHQVLVRDLTMFGLPGHLRVSVGTPNEMQRFCAALSEVLAAPPRPVHLGYGLGSAEGTITVPTLTPVEPDALFNGYVGAQVVFALSELGVLSRLADEPASPTALATASGTDPTKLLALLRAAALLGYVEIGDVVSLTEAGRNLVHRHGFFTWGVGGYSDLLRGLADLASGTKEFDSDITRDGNLVAKGAGEVGHRMMLPVEHEVLSGIEFDSIADLGCGDATRLLRLCGPDNTRSGTGIDINAAACRAAEARVAEAGLSDRIDVVHADVLQHFGGRTFPGIDLVASFLMMHDLFEATGDPAGVMQLLRRVFPDATRFLIGDTVAQDWHERTAPLPIFSVGFELVHAFMDTPINDRSSYEDSFAAAGLRIARREPLGAPSTWLWLLETE